MSDEQKKDDPQQPTEDVTESASAEAKVSNAAAPEASKATEADYKPSAAESAAVAEPSAAQPAETKSAAAETEKPAAPAADKAAPTDEEKEAKAKAAAEARAARASARAKKPEDEENAAPKEPSPLQPRLDYFVKLIKEAMGDDTVQEAFINEKDAHLPCVVLKNANWFETAELLHSHSELKLNYLRNVSGVDYETYMEVVYHLLSLETKHEYCIKVKTDREAPSVPSVTTVWPTANWNEREIYDLLGIDFPGHPDMRRIMMSDDWVGHPLRKDYEPLDPEV
ncbi:NADH-quinone oxidoreductase subunit C [Paenibacillus sp. LMG 31456]|uniref:NADH-quinone oxidoreductase subunit C n=1 Tax=Paenibacillus foliorum TaxID=2654974 RepID=A0A972GRV5_9BACL|nr:NADH-quinone oxidoreductase subunit C [Paenibacillus foliorum]NOU95045.1 NADH-quinone oxidoreductase subunit C [Paenibacillus foliorum]